jgi:nifR3 family TIM-barrel protein
LRIGNLTIDPPVVLAALAGYSDHPYRLLCRQAGAPFCATEMMLDKSVLIGGKLQRQLLMTSQADHPIAGQLIGSEPGTMARAAGLLCRTGFDVVDLNFACPVHKALRRRRGGYFLRDPEAAVRIVQAVVAVADRPVTVKVRRSFEQADTANEAFWRLAEGAFEAGVAALCLHARSVEARYGGSADWDFLTRVKEHFRDRTIIGSGDVLTPAAALRMLAETGVDGVAVGRGALGNPWFFRQAADLAAGRPPYRPDLAAQRAVILRHFEHSCEVYGPVRGPKVMRKFGIKYARLHPEPRRVRVAFVAIKRPEQCRALIDELYPENLSVAGGMARPQGSP